jgi:hypothetical protein
MAEPKKKDASFDARTGFADPEEATREARASFVRRRIEGRLPREAPPLDDPSDDQVGDREASGERACRVESVSGPHFPLLDPLPAWSEAVRPSGATTQPPPMPEANVPDPFSAETRARFKRSPVPRIATPQPFRSQKPPESRRPARPTLGPISEGLYAERSL